MECELHLLNKEMAKAVRDAKICGETDLFVSFDDSSAYGGYGWGRAVRTRGHPEAEQNIKYTGVSILSLIPRQLDNLPVDSITKTLKAVSRSRMRVDLTG